MAMSKGQESDSRAVATWVAQRLRSSGHLAYFAGGCVRDRLLGLEPSDHDVVTDARPDAIRGLFRSAVGVGESFGVMLVRRQGQTVEVATFRSDGVYEDGRRPDSVTFSDPRSDAARRDFTINAIFEDPDTGDLIDHFDGAGDLDRRLLRAVGDPRQRLEEDHLRALRGVRFAARYGLEIEPATREAIAASAPVLRGVSRERVGGELRRMLHDPSRLRAVSLLESFAMDAPVLLEPHRAVESHRALRALGEVEREPIDALAAWHLDRGGSLDLAEAARLREALLLSNREHRALEGILGCIEAIRLEWATLPVAGRKRLAARDGFSVALELVASGDPGLAERVTTELEPLRAEGLAPEPLIDGNDLIELGIEPGPRFRTLLDAVYDAQLEGRVLERADALALARSLT